MRFLVVVLLTLVASAEARAACEKGEVLVFADGRPTGRLCDEQARALGLTIVDLSDEFVPRVLAASPYRTTVKVLADNTGSYLELYGIFPTLRVHHARLADMSRHSCHALIDPAPLRSYGPLRRDAATPKRRRLEPGRTAAVRVLQGHLACEQLLPFSAVNGRYGSATVRALARYRQRAVVPVPRSGDADAPFIEAISAGGRELDYRALLRTLRERVVAATGLIEDGSARGESATVMGRLLDSAPIRDVGGRPPLENGAPDLVSPATEAAAYALGWNDPDSATASLGAILRDPAARRVALRLPHPPAYHSPSMELRAEIDRGDVWPGDLRRRQPRELRPIITLFAKDGDGGEIALVRWPTTIGGWQAERMAGGGVVKRYKPSLPGAYQWTEVIGAPVWYPPSSTPDRELVRRSGGRWALDEGAIGPGYRSAYGLAMVVHRSLDGDDTYVRTHGTGNYLSVLGAGDSHGCHRLFTHLALRLTSFLLAHRSTTLLGVAREAFERKVEWEGASFTLRRTIRGTVYVIDPPVPVRVLEGRVLSRLAEPNAW